MASVSHTEALKPELSKWHDKIWIDFLHETQHDSNKTGSFYCSNTVLLLFVLVFFHYILFKVQCGYGALQACWYITLAYLTQACFERVSANVITMQVMQEQWTGSELTYRNRSTNSSSWHCVQRLTILWTSARINNSDTERWHITILLFKRTNRLLTRHMEMTHPHLTESCCVTIFSVVDVIGKLWTA